MLWLWKLWWQRLGRCLLGLGRHGQVQPTRPALCQLWLAVRAWIIMLLAVRAWILMMLAVILVLLAAWAWILMLLAVRACITPRLLASGLLATRAWALPTRWGLRCAFITARQGGVTQKAYDTKAKSHQRAHACGDHPAPHAHVLLHESVITWSRQPCHPNRLAPQTAGQQQHQQQQQQPENHRIKPHGMIC